jgi:anthranilate/para-aminobenzoate synthase component I
VKAPGSLPEVEAALRAEGFFEGGADGLVADVYLGYGLSGSIRRDAAPAPPEPCPLPPAAIDIRPANDPFPALQQTVTWSVGEWERTWSDGEYSTAVEAVREAIAAGDVYQVNLVQHLSAPFSGDPAGLASALAPLRPLAPRPLLGDGWAIVSASPELFLCRRGRRVWTMPIKGTRPRGVPGLTESEKDAAVDLIAALEPVGRGASMGAYGTVRPNGDLDLALTIRTFAVADDRIHLWVGGGIVWDSDPAEEIEESWTKAAPLLAAIGAPLPEPALR